MTELLAAASALTKRWSSFAPPTRLQSIVARLPEAAAQKVSTPEETAALQARLASRYDAVGVSSLSFREFRDLPTGFWLAPQPLDEHGKLFADFLERIKTTRSKNGMRRLVHAFLDRYPDKSKSRSKAREFIAAELPAFPSKFVDLEREWQVFSETGGVKRLAAAVLKDGTVVLERVGLPENLWTFRFVEEVFRQACKLLKPADADQVGHLSRFAVRLGAKRLEALRFPGSKGELLEGLLGKWRDKPPPPDSPAKRAIMALIDTTFGDPRTFRAAWKGIDEGLQRTYLKWLAIASLKQFFDIVDRSMRATEDGRRMWPARRRYWTAWFDSGAIDEAWVAFGPTAYDDARQASAKDPTFGRSYAKVEPAKGGYHSALIMKFGDHTVVDWSYMGRCGIWPKSNGAAKIGSSQYHHEDLSGAPISVVHREGWQQRISVELQQLTGRRPPPTN